MLAVEDQLDALGWATQIGGLSALIARSQANLSVVRNWVDQSSWAAFLTPDISQQSSTSICLKIIDPIFGGLPDSAQRAFIKSMTALLEQKNVAFDIAAYRDAPPGLRLWGGATVESTDLEKLTPWLDWAFSETLMTVS